MILPQEYMQMALGLARIRQGFCAPNPSVGALLVKDAQVIATGYHMGPGTKHAEIAAMEKLDKQTLAQATLYVTLEPCCTYGRTPPCTQALIQAGIKKVYCGYQDSNSNVAGKGIEQLESAGIECHKVDLEEVDAFYAAYDFWHRQQKPWVTAKIALSLDGKIAGQGGIPEQISGSELALMTHLYRKRSDAILTTAKTVQNDNPRLNVRLPTETLVKPLYIIDKELNTPLDANVFHTGARVTLFHSGTVPQARVLEYEIRGSSCQAVSASPDGLNWEEILRMIGKDGVHHLWVEAGATCFQSLLRAEHLQEALIYISTKILGADAHPGFNQPALFTRAQKTLWEAVGSDAICHLLF